MMRKAIILTCLGLATGLLFGAGPPQAEITNGQIRAKIYLPDAKRGFYRGTRFDWSGVIGSLEYMGHNYYGPWFDKVDSSIRDFGFVGPTVLAAPSSAVSGPADDFLVPQGWDAAKPGETCVKIGVGAIRKDDKPYNRVGLYPIVNPGKWTIRRQRDSVEFTHELNDPVSGYGYVYRKLIRLEKGKPAMVLEHRLRNTGRLPIQGMVYNHNFLVLDKQPSGPDFTITVPFQIQTRQPIKKELGAIHGNQVVYLKTLQGDEEMGCNIRGFGESPADYDLRIENKKVGAGLKITGDRPLVNLNLWSIRTTVSLEPYVALKIEPGSEYAWKASYEYYTIPVK
jgi:hypothetical protein